VIHRDSSTRESCDKGLLSTAIPATDVLSMQLHVNKTGKNLLRVYRDSSNSDVKSVERVG
jgi:hypothetical protein